MKIMLGWLLASQFQLVVFFLITSFIIKMWKRKANESALKDIHRENEKKIMESLFEVITTRGVYQV